MDFVMIARMLCECMQLKKIKEKNNHFPLLFINVQVQIIKIDLQTRRTVEENRINLYEQFACTQIYK